MSGITTNEGYPYPGTGDFADVQDAFRLAMAIDSDLRAAQAPIRSFLGRPSFIGRSTSNSSGISNGSVYLNIGAIEWDNTGGLTIGQNSWSQPNAQEPSWWLLGANLITYETGSPAVNDLLFAEMTISSADQVTGVFTNTTFVQRNDDSNTNGEWVNVYGMAAVYHGSVNVQLNANGSNTKGISSGSRLWGLYLGPVS